MSVDTKCTYGAEGMRLNIKQCPAAAPPHLLRCVITPLDRLMQRPPSLSSSSTPEVELHLQRPLNERPHRAAAGLPQRIAGVHPQRLPPALHKHPRPVQVDRHPGRALRGAVQQPERGGSLSSGALEQAGARPAFDRKQKRLLGAELHLSVYTPRRLIDDSAGWSIPLYSTLRRAEM